MVYFPHLQQAIINCFKIAALARTGSARDVLNEIEKNIPKIEVKHCKGDFLATVTHPDLAKFNSEAIITMTKEGIAEYAKDIVVGDSPEDERKLFLRIYSETFGHELCHLSEHPNTHPGDDDGFVYTEEYYNTAMGVVRN